LREPDAAPRVRALLDQFQGRPALAAAAALEQLLARRLKILIREGVVARRRHLEVLLAPGAVRVLRGPALELLGPQALGRFLLFV